MAVLEAKHYQETRDRLAKDPIVIAMAASLTPEVIDAETHDSGSVKFGFMLAANEEYAKRGGSGQGHIGAVAEALAMIVRARG